MKNVFLFTLFLFTASFSYGQFGYGMTASTDVYQIYQNPEEDGHGTAGSALLNLGLGPKIWVGGNNFSVSAEAMANIGIFGLSVTDYKGLGMVSFPMMVKFNFAGLSGFDSEGRFGLSIGGGIQYSKTELYYTKDSFTGNRDFFTTYVGQIGYGFGVSGFSIHGFLRYGHEPDTKANTFNVGVQYDFNLPKLKNITAPESAL